MVEEFHATFGLPIRTEPALPDFAEQLLRYNLLAEEFNEYKEAVFEGQGVVAIADALADMVYVIYGTALCYGIDLDAVLRAVHDSNMSKLDENWQPILRADGKVLKSSNYQPPRIAEALGL